MQRFTNLRVWQEGHALALEVHRMTRSFPADERFGLTQQLRRAATSVPTNIAEGSKRRSNTEFARFLNIAEGSLVETEYFLMLSRDLDYLDQSKATQALAAVARLAGQLNNPRVRAEREPRP